MSLLALSERSASLKALPEIRYNSIGLFGFTILALPGCGDTLISCWISLMAYPLQKSRLSGMCNIVDFEGSALKVSVKQISVDMEERAIIQCYEVSDDIKSIVSFIKSTGATLAGYIDERASQIPLQDIFFVEAVDNKVFAYTAKKVYELKCKLYEFEAQYENRRFFRCSKSFVINLMKINNVRPILNGRFSATLLNGEEVIISRQYVPELKKRLLGESI